MGDVMLRGGGYACHAEPGGITVDLGAPGSFMLWWRLNTGEKELQELNDIGGEGG